MVNDKETIAILEAIDAYIIANQAQQAKVARTGYSTDVVSPLRVGVDAFLAQLQDSGFKIVQLPKNPPIIPAVNPTIK